MKSKIIANNNWAFTDFFKKVTPILRLKIGKIDVVAVISKLSKQIQRRFLGINKAK